MSQISRHYRLLARIGEAADVLTPDASGLGLNRLGGGREVTLFLPEPPQARVERTRVQTCPCLRARIAYAFHILRDIRSPSCEVDY